MDEVLGEDFAAEKGVVFDARNQYYRIWMWLVAQTKAAMISGDFERWRLSVVALFNHAQSFFTPEERKAIEERLVAARVAAEQLQGFNRRGSAFHEAFVVHRRACEAALNDAERLIYDAMKARNMLLPQSAGGGAGFDIEKVMREADL